MPQSGATEGQKRRAAESAVAAVEDETVVGLGTGSTAAAAIRALGRRVADGLDVGGGFDGLHDRLPDADVVGAGVVVPRVVHSRVL